MDELTKKEIMIMLYHACCLFDDKCGLEAPDWIRIISGANPKMLAEAIEIAFDDDTYDTLLRSDED